MFTLIVRYSLGFTSQPRARSALAILLAIAATPHPSPAAGAATRPSLPKLDAKYGQLPLSFEPNVGQTSKEVQFLSRTPSGTLYLTSQEAVFVISEARKHDSRIAKSRFHEGPAINAEPRKSTVVRMKLEGANPKARVIGLEKLPGIANYFIGNNPKKWHTRIPTCGKVRYLDVYPGIDLTYYGNRQQLEYDFVVKPGADPKQIAVAIEGADGIHLDSNGDLIIATPFGELHQHKPIVYQETTGKRHSIVSNFVLKASSEVGFRIAEYDNTNEVVIDPVLSYSTFLGGNDNPVVGGDEVGYGIAVDTAGNAYVTGDTGALDFPTVNAFQGTYAGGQTDAFITKIGPSGTALVYSTYLGGDADRFGIGGGDIGYGIAVDASGNAYITGATTSKDFPIVGAIQPLNGMGDAFVAKLDASGAALVFSTYLGGSGTFEYGTGIAVDAFGSAYVAGTTNSTDFPTANAAQSTLGGEDDIFVTKFNQSGNTLIFSTYLGGADGEEPPISGGIAVDNLGSAYVTGRTYSTDFPTVNAIQGVLRGTSDAFVTKFDPSGMAFAYSTYLGGSSDDPGNGIAVDGAGNAYISGSTASTDFPIANAIQPFLGGSGDAFVTHLNASGSAFIYSTYLGGTSNDVGTGIAVDNLGNAYIAGSTASTDFPVVNAIQGTLSGRGDAFVTKLNANGTALVFSTYLGGSADETEYGMAVDTSGNAYVTGWTKSLDFPTVNAVQRTFGGGDADAFITKISEGGLSLHSPLPTSSPSAIIASPSDSVDTPLQLVPDEARLKGQPLVVSGLVADGVTPLLIQFDPNPVPTIPTNYTIAADVDPTNGSISGGLPSHLYVLQQTGNVSQFVLGDRVTVSTTDPSAFAYINGIPSEDLMLNRGFKELNVTLKITKEGDATPTATIPFRIRKPPIVLVHGIFSDNNSWYDGSAPRGFLAALQAVFPSDFIMPVGTGPDSQHSNTFGKFEDLAPCLDLQLQSAVEYALSTWHQGWAFTRYDIIGHSQGGLLARMLATRYKNWGTPSFRSESNAYRGRFHRIVTLNSPHNGTTLYYYLRDLSLAAPRSFVIPEYLALLTLNKFNPFGTTNQISQVIGNWPADANAKFNLVGTTINEGQPPVVDQTLPLCYSVFGMSVALPNQQNSRGSVVIPYGSDGIVDFLSEFAGQSPGLPGHTLIIAQNIAHGGLDSVLDSFADDLFDSVSYVLDSQTTGETVATLLNGPPDKFAPFTFSAIDPALAGQIDAIIPPVSIVRKLIKLLRSDKGLAAGGESATVYQYKLAPPSDHPLAGSPSWQSEVIGPSGITMEGVTLTSDPTNSSIVSVWIDDSVLGDVILQVTYTDVDGNFVTADPIVIISRPPGTTLTNIESVPNALTLSIGGTATLQVWGHYDNGTQSQLYVPPDAAITYTSDNPSIARIDANGIIRAKAVGAATTTTNYLGFSAQSTVAVMAPPPPPILAPLGAGSRKLHKTAGAFDLNLPLTGDEAIECRSGGRVEKYQLVVTFASPVTVANAVLSSGIGSVTNFQVAGTQVTINLAGVTNAQRIAVTLSGVSDGTIANDVVIPMAVLVGDLTADGIVDTTDVTEARSVIRQALTIVNFRDDVTVDGQLDKKDAQTVRSNLGTQLPP